MGTLDGEMCYDCQKPLSVGAMSVYKGDYEEHLGFRCLDCAEKLGLLLPSFYHNGKH